MHSHAIALTWLAWWGQGQRAQISNKQVQNHPYVQNQQQLNAAFPATAGTNWPGRRAFANSTTKPLRAMPTFLWASNQAIAFKPAGCLVGNPSCINFQPQVLDKRNRRGLHVRATNQNDRGDSKIANGSEQEILLHRLGTLGIKNALRRDDVVIRTFQGRDLAIPQVSRYRTSDWGEILWRTATSTLLRRIRGPVLINMCWAAVVWTVHKYFGFSMTSLISLHRLVGSALGLLLVFRTNTAYQRFWEGRKIWEDLQGNARGLAHYCMLYRNELSMDRVKRVANLICVFSSVLAEHLGAHTHKYYSDLVTREDAVQLHHVGHRPMHVLNLIGEELHAIPDQSKGGQVLFSARERLALLSYVKQMIKSIGACERLVQTPVPLNYVRHTARVLAIWLLTLPIALVGDMGTAIVPAMGLISWMLFGIQEIGLMIEEPFRRTLNLDVIVRTIYDDILETTMMPEWRKWSKKAVERSNQETGNKSTLRQKTRQHKHQ